MIASLIERGYAYAAGGDVYYASASSPATASCPGNRRRLARRGARRGRRGEARPARLRAVEGGQPGEPRGTRPGARTARLAHRVLGDVEAPGRAFDIHGGGEDLKFPHHENEIAQCEGARAGRS